MLKRKKSLGQGDVAKTGFCFSASPVLRNSPILKMDNEFVFFHTLKFLTLLKIG
jgi:hypothetical protein